MSSITSSHSMSRISTGRIALIITLGAESVFFVTLLVAYAALRNEVAWNIPHTLTRLALPLINTIILLVSAVSASASIRAIRRDNQIALRKGLLAAALLGLLFLAGQTYEFKTAGFQINDPAFGGVFFTLMGFHAVHILAGLIFHALNYMRATLGDFSAERYEAVELGGWFWYYVTAVWAVLFVMLYLV